MAHFYVVNKTACPVKVTVSIDRNEPDVLHIILSSESVPVTHGKMVVESTLSKYVHKEMLVPKTPDEFTVRVDNRIGAIINDGRSVKGDHLLVITGFSC